MALDLAFMLQILPDMIAAFWLTIKISLITVVASVIAGILLTAIRMMGGKISRYSIIAFVEFTRGAPPLVHISIIYFLLPEFGIVFNEFWTGVIALSLIGAGYSVEIFRGAIDSIGSSQVDASKAIGLSRVQTFRLVLIPQALRLSLPPLTNELANVIKASSLLSVISVNELTKVANDLIFVHFVVIEVLIELTCLYLIIVGFLMFLSKYMEAKFKY
ncbi:MAG: ABC transporter permease [Alphaproteobacteria bacterium]|jgi:polar amino acid transport system permease protein|nr:ABC transporter permease [Alphaproteobacteria bacterium]|tara:strand:+ start:218 stop:868 length:651 start_codon:yes stop_codon:yes gene_type:complete